MPDERTEDIAKTTQPIGAGILSILRDTPPTPQTAAEIVKKLTGSPDLNAEEMIEDPETRRLFIEARERESDRKRARASAKLSGRSSPL
jgi:hypothetical protein